MKNPLDECGPTGHSDDNPEGNKKVPSEENEISPKAYSEEMEVIRASYANRSSAHPPNPWSSSASPTCQAFRDPIRTPSIPQEKELQKWKEINILSQSDRIPSGRECFLGRSQV